MDINSADPQQHPLTGTVDILVESNWACSVVETDEETESFQSFRNSQFGFYRGNTDTTNYFPSFMAEKSLQQKIFQLNHLLMKKLLPFQ